MCARVGVSVRVSALLVGAPETLCCCVFVSRVVLRCVESVQDFSRQCYINKNNLYILIHSMNIERFLQNTLELPNPAEVPTSPVGIYFR